jgi:hypothetical protein
VINNIGVGSMERHVFDPEEITTQTGRYLSESAPLVETINTDLARAGMDCLEKISKKDIWDGSIIGPPGNSHKIKYFPREDSFAIEPLGPVGEFFRYSWPEKKEKLKNYWKKTALPAIRDAYRSFMNYRINFVITK